MTTYWLRQGDAADVLKRMRSDYADALVTDPPAGIGFMGKEWDHHKGGMDEWTAWLAGILRECYRVLKPGAHGLVWALPRTSHWTALALERAGFEIRDCVTHLFGTGFPKSLDVSKAIDKAAGAEREVIGVRQDFAARANKTRGEGQWRDGSGFANPDQIGAITAPATDAARQWQGWGTALKPAAEFWWLVRKPLGEKTVAANVLRHGTGAINVDGCRIGTTENLNGGAYSKGREPRAMTPTGRNERETIVNRDYEQPTGRFPANLVLSCCGSDPHDDGCAVAMLDGQSGEPVSNSTGKGGVRWIGFHGVGAGSFLPPRPTDTGGASRFFYVAKASRSDRGEGNTHPTVKSTALMRYLVRLVTPHGGVVLDPFMGSGSTGVAAISEGMRFVGVERDEAYFRVAENRVANP